jgi:catechol 2,3-dioxygenase-like lactoylglutathione lyase family enzyme
MMKTVLVFAVGVMLGALLFRPSVAQDAQRRVLNHVGVVVENYEEAMDFYMDGLGLREAYTVRQADGSPLLTYLQFNRDTFIELIPVTPQNPQPGITHFGIEVGDIQATVAHLRAEGLTVPDPGMTPANAEFIRMRDSEGVQIEVMQFGPEALQRRAMDAWER